MNAHRDRTTRIHIGQIPIGAGAPVSIQSMTNTRTSDAGATIEQIQGLAQAGCDIARASIPDADSLAAFPAIVQNASIPVVADIHFDYQLAIGAIEAGAAGIRINPGNIGSRAKVQEVAKAAIEHATPIRVGVNMGSVKPEMLKKHAADKVGALVESADEQVKLLEDLGVRAIKVSLKSSDVRQTIEAYRRYAQVSTWPLHVGVTEAGTLFSGSIRSAAGIGILLAEGIGDTIRVSLSAPPVKEVLAGAVLLECLGLRSQGIRVISCPTCARSNADIAAIAAAVEDAVAGLRGHLSVAVMGCVVNGPGEAREADMGVACDPRGALFFVKGKILKRIQTSEIIPTLIDAIQKEINP